MRTLLYGSGAGSGFLLFPPALLAGPLEDMQTLVGEVPAYVLAVFALLVAVLVYFSRSREDRRTTPLNKIVGGRRAVHGVPPDTPVTTCVSTMTAEKIGALMVMDGERLIGIFTERDALNRVLAAGRDPRSTKVSEVMTKNPYCVPPSMTLADAMQVVTKGRFRHLPIVENDKVLAVLSSGDLTHWLVKDQTGELHELVDLASRHN